LQSKTGSKVIILWLTDIHLDYLFPKERRQFLQSLGTIRPEIVLMGGDISRADHLEDDLRAIRKATNAPVYFVQGNHDFFGSSFASVNDCIGRLVKESISLHWLEHTSHINLAKDVALVGHGCWGDAGTGSFWNSELSRDMPDFREIADFKNINRHNRLLLLKQLGAEAARHLELSCHAAAYRHRNVLVLTHVPPFPETSLHGGKINEAGLPFFCCLAAGKVLREVAKTFDQVQFTVLSGHSHQDARVQVLPNLEAIVQGAQYHKPASRILHLENGILVDEGAPEVLKTGELGEE
jgi:predicted MPP superfamily phosphohydrolase